MNRRDLIKSGAAVGPPLLGLLPGLAVGRDLIEYQQGDPDAVPEELVFNPANETASWRKKATYRARNPSFSDALIQVAAEFIGFSRQANADQIGDFLRLCRIEPMHKGRLQPFCAAGVTYAAALAYLRYWKVPLGGGQPPMQVLQDALPELDHHHFFPTASVNHLYEAASAKGRWTSRSGVTSPSPGWLVVFDWHGTGANNHVGIVEGGDQSTIHTIEFNTTLGVAGSQSDGGVITRRTRRTGRTIKGYVRTDLVLPL